MFSLILGPRARPIYTREDRAVKEWTTFINKSNKNEFETLLADIMSEALAKLDTVPDEELERLIDCE